MELTLFERENITIEYEKKIEIPKHLSPYKLILAPVGLVGSGKTTVVKPLSKRFSLVRISSDEIREILKGLNYSYTQDDVMYIAEVLLKKYLNKGYGVTYDSNCENKIDIIDKLAKDYHAKILWVNITPPEKFILNKLKNMYYNEGHVFKNADQAIATYFKDKPTHRNLKMTFIAEIDTSQIDINDKIDEAGNSIETFLNTY